MRKIAHEIEFAGAHAQASARVESAYNKAAGEEVEPIYPSIARYVGAANHPDYAQLRLHETLHKRYTRIKSAVEDLDAILKRRFTLSSREEGHHETRRFSLSVDWDDAEYDKRINSALVSNPNVGARESGADVFDWRKLEERILLLLRRAEAVGSGRPRPRWPLQRLDRRAPRRR